MQYEENHLGQKVGFEVPGWRPVALPTRAPMVGRLCRLEPLQADRHAKDLYQAMSLDPEGSDWTYLPYGPFGSFDEYIAWLNEFTTGQDPLFFAIIDQATNKAVGQSSYLRIDPKHGVIEIGHLYFSRLLQARPAATEAIYLMMSHAFEHGYRRLEWKCHSCNAKSRRSAQRLGLSYEGIFRQAAVFKGRNRDTAWYAAIDQEWPELKNAFERWLSPENFDHEGKQNVSLSSLTASILKQHG